jgi:outer membrane protein assembly factor BamE
VEELRKLAKLAKLELEIAYYIPVTSGAQSGFGAPCVLRLRSHRPRATFLESRKTSPMYSPIVRACLVGCFALFCAACTYLTPYKVEVQQGTVVTPENVGRLKLGMTRSQVSFVMGTPLLADAFHADRWDYVYYLRKRERVVERRKVALFFDGDALKDIRSDLPVDKDAASPAAPAATPATAPAAIPAPTAPAPASPTTPPAANQ